VPCPAVGLRWWSLGIVLALGYFIVAYRFVFAKGQRESRRQLTNGAGAARPGPMPHHSGDVGGAQPAAAACASSSCVSSADSSIPAAPTFSSRCLTEAVPGIGSITAER
jgi:hypothetical protein